VKFAALSAPLSAGEGIRGYRGYMSALEQFADRQTQTAPQEDPFLRDFSILEEGEVLLERESFLRSARIRGRVAAGSSEPTRPPSITAAQPRTGGNAEGTACGKIWGRSRAPSLRCARYRVSDTSADPKLGDAPAAPAVSRRRGLRPWQCGTTVCRNAMNLPPAACFAIRLRPRRPVDPPRI